MTNKIDTIKVKKMIHTIGLNNNLTDEQVTEIVESQFRFAYEKIMKMQITGIQPEEIENIKTNFYFKYIGKLYANSDNLDKLKRRSDYLNKLKKEDGRNEEF